MKRIITIFIVLVLFFNFNLTFFAFNDENVFKVFSDKVELVDGKQTLVPVKISGNTGIMGFRISIKYDNSLIDIKSVTRGEITSKGMFNDSMGAKNGSFDIVWSHSENVKDDGTLFVLSVVPEKELSSDIIIKLSYKEEDTFNEQWEDVKLECEDIILAKESSQIISSEQLESSIVTENNISENKLSESQIIDSVKIALTDVGVKKISEVKNKRKFVESYKNNIKIIANINEDDNLTFNKVKSLYHNAYKTEYVNEIKNSIDKDKINNIFSALFEKYGVSNISELKSKNKKSFIKDLYAGLKDEYGDIDNIADYFDEDEALDIIKELETKEIINNDFNYFPIIIILTIVGVMLIAITFYSRKRKKK